MNGFNETEKVFVNFIETIQYDLSIDNNGILLYSVIQTLSNDHCKLEIKMHTFVTNIVERIT